LLVVSTKMSLLTELGTAGKGLPALPGAGNVGAVGSGISAIRVARTARSGVTRPTKCVADFRGCLGMPKKEFFIAPKMTVFWQILKTG
jgi:hypothetical protein